MKPIRLLAIDLDGTLLGPDHRILPQNERAVQACRAAGLRVVIASGRMFYSVRTYCAQLGLTGPMITLNGGSIAEAPDGIPEPGLYLEEVSVLSLANALRESVAVCDLWAKHHLRPPRHVALGGTGGVWGASRGRGAGVDRSYVPDPVKFLVFAEEDLDQELASLAEDGVATVRSNARFFEYMCQGTSKGAALTQILHRLDVPRESVLAVGDHFNDLSLFAAAGVSVAMGNAPAEVRAAANYVTARCEKGGLALALEQHVLRRLNDTASVK